MGMAVNAAGKWTQALKAFRDIFHIQTKKNVRLPAKMYTDLCANELFLLALMKLQESAATRVGLKKRHCWRKSEGFL